MYVFKHDSGRYASFNAAVVFLVDDINKATIFDKCNKTSLPRKGKHYTKVKVIIQEAPCANT